MVMIKRSYRQNCSLALAADVIGERWSLLLFRELLIKPKKYNELLANCPGIGTNLLANRLKELMQLELIEKNQEGKYSLLPKGLALEPVILQMVRWGLQFTETKEGFLHQDEWDVIALKALFNPSKCPSGTVRFHWRYDSLSFLIVISNGQFSFQIDPSETTCDVEWRWPLTDLVSPDALFRVPESQRAHLRQFISSFDPIGPA